MRKLVFSMLMAMSLSYVFSENTIDLHSLTSSSPPSELTIQSHLGVGFFGELAKVVNGILHFENENLQKIHVDWSQEFFPYKDDPFSNGWDLFFEPIQVCTNPLDVAESRKIVAGGNYHHIHDFHCIDQWINYESHLNYRLDMHRVINKYIKLNDEILDKKSVFFGNHMSGFYCIGVHIRYGADHGAEAPAGIPTLNDYIDEVKSLLKSQNSNRTRIYLATDSHYVVDQFKKEFPHILLHISAFRTKYRD